MSAKRKLPTFKVGDQVTWSSQAKGGEKAKAGEVRVVVPAGKRAGEIADHHGVAGFPTFQYTLMNNLWGTPRNHESYLVVVPKASPRGNSKPKVYWPRASALRLVRAGGSR